MHRLAQERKQQREELAKAAARRQVAAARAKQKADAAKDPFGMDKALGRGLTFREYRRGLARSRENTAFEENRPPESPLEEEEEEEEEEASSVGFGGESAGSISPSVDWGPYDLKAPPFPPSLTLILTPTL